MPTPSEIKDLEGYEDKIKAMRNLLIELRNKEIAKEIYKDLIQRTDKVIGWKK